MNQGSYIANTKSKIHISSSRVLLADRNGQYFNCRTFRRNCLNNSERATVGLEIIQFARLWNNGPNSRLRRAYFRTNSFVITSMVTYSVQRECARHGVVGERNLRDMKNALFSPTCHRRVRLYRVAINNS